MAATPSTSKSPGEPPTPPSPTLSQLPPVPGSPVFSLASTANPISSYNLPLPPPPPPRAAPAILTKADLAASQTAYADLLSSAKTYRQALAALGVASSTFGSALESCARLKEAKAEALPPADKTPPPLSNAFSLDAGGPCTADALHGAGGVQHLIANHVQILSEAVYRAFEVPLLHELDKWKVAVEDEEESYTRRAKEQGKEIRRLEKEGLKLHRQRGKRDVARFRDHLVELTNKLDGLTTLHGQHARSLLRESQDASVKIVDASASLVRAEVDIFESLARKGWSGGGLEDLLEKGADLFASDDVGAAGGANGNNGARGGSNGPTSESKLFSILPPHSILADSASDKTTRPGMGHHARTDSLLVGDEAGRYQSLIGAVGGGTDAGGGRDTDSLSVFSEFNRSRGVVRPFSPPPQPVRLNPDGLIAELEEQAASTEARGSKTAKDERASGLTQHEHKLQRYEEEDVVDDLALPTGRLGMEDEDKDLEAHQAWNNTTPRKLTLGRFNTGSTASLTSTQLRERRWSATKESEASEEDTTVD
jgi:hypothetical protein